MSVYLVVDILQHSFMSVLFKVEYRFLVLRLYRFLVLRLYRFCFLKFSSMVSDNGF